MTEARVTIVVVPREQFSKAQASLESIYAATPEPFELVYVDGNSPPPVRRYLEQQAGARGFRLLQTERYLTSNEARNLGLREVRTEYVAFLDNDIFVLPGWLEALLRCAEQTGAWVVGPLYCYGTDGGSGQPHVVHTAGASFRIVEDGAYRLREDHRHVNRPVAEVRPQLRREPIDLVEFHCMLVRASAFDRMGPLDEKLLSFLDHVDFCLAARQAGGTVYFEPDAIATHLAPPPFAPMDVPYFLLRWSDAWLRPSIRHFACKHRLSARDRGFRGHVSFRNQHRRRLVGGIRRTIERFLGKWGLRIADEIADRIIFNLLIEHTIVRRMQRNRARSA
jgi:GT2 family glycosyltransferase